MNICGEYKGLSLFSHMLTQIMQQRRWQMVNFQGRYNDAVVFASDNMRLLYDNIRKHF